MSLPLRGCGWIVSLRSTWARVLQLWLLLVVNSVSERLYLVSFIILSLLASGVVFVCEVFVGWGNTKRKKETKSMLSFLLDIESSFYLCLVVVSSTLTGI